MEVQGDPTEGALITAAAKGGFDPKDWSNRLRRLDAIPFESQHQFMATLHEHDASASEGSMSKRAAEVILAKCVHMMDETGKHAPFDAVTLQRATGKLSDKGLRVLVLASPTSQPAHHRSPMPT